MKNERVEKCEGGVRGCRVECLCAMDMHLLCATAVPLLCLFIWTSLSFVVRAPDQALRLLNIYYFDFWVQNARNIHAMPCLPAAHANNIHAMPACRPCP